MKRLLYGVAVLLILFFLTACGGDETNGDEPAEDIRLTGRPVEPPGYVEAPGTQWVYSTVQRPMPAPGAPPTPAHWPMGADLLARRPVDLQLTPLVAGEELVILHTNHGDITVRLFPQAAPIAVENFMTHAANGFFDGLTFHRVMPGFMIQGGCSEGNGMGGQSIWGQSFGVEHNYDLWHFNGALAAAQTGQANSIGSQFYIVHSNSLDAFFRNTFEEMLTRLDEIAYPLDWDGEGPYLRWGEVHTRAKLEHYLEVGGTPHLDFPFNTSGPNWGHTVFGQVVWGMEAVNSIASTPLVPVPAPNQPSVPVDPVIIERTSIIVYQG